jgi:hypothetical protein
MTTAINLYVDEAAGMARTAWPITRGVSFPASWLDSTDKLRVADHQDRQLPLQARALAHWPDGSIKWALVDVQADLPGASRTTYRLRQDAAEAAVRPPVELCLEEDGAGLTVDTGVLRFVVDKGCCGILGDAVVVDPAGATSSPAPSRGVQARKAAGVIGAEPLIRARGMEAWANISESASDGATGRRLYGPGGRCSSRRGTDDFSVVIEEAGPLRAVIRCAGVLEAETPGLHYAGYQPLRFITRMQVYAGHAFVRVLHTVIFTANARETEIEEIGLEVPLIPVPGSRFYTALEQPFDGDLDGAWWTVEQPEDNHGWITRARHGETQRCAEAERAAGWALVGTDSMGVGVALRHMAEEFPKALSASSDSLRVYPWRHPSGRRLSYSRYSEEMAWDAGEGVYADGTGSARTTEFFVLPYSGSRIRAQEELSGLLSWPGAVVEPGWTAGCQVAVGSVAASSRRFPASERMLQGFVDWMRTQVKLSRWYGYLDHGDVMCTWDDAGDDWRYRGRWGWCNSEWDPRHALWIQFLRTADTGLFSWAEAMTRHSVDVDTCHYQPLRPYMVGGCYRHSIGHFGDEPCASHTFLDNWYDYYCLTGDQRTLEVVREAGEFLARYSWSEDPRFSISLRSIANALRGLLYAWEVTADEAFLRRAEEMYTVIAAGQNEDGSWNKRFHPRAPGHLPAQAPYGMATEGTTLAVEMGTAAPFTDAELKALGGSFSKLTRVMPLAEQRGYQTHYLLVGLELLLQLTGREDVRVCYLRGVDWFCGTDWDVEFALSQHYYGILCRHLGQAYTLTGEERYLHLGRGILRHLVQIQDWSDDPRRRGAVGMTPTALSLLFYGVPHLLGALAGAGMEE